MSLEEELKKDNFVITTQINLNQFKSPGDVLKYAESVSPFVDAIIINENLTTDMGMSSIAISHILKDTGVDIIFNFCGNCHSKKKMSSLVTTSWFLGIRNLCISENNTHLFNYKGDSEGKKGITVDEMHSLINSLSAGKTHDKMDFFLGSIIDFEEKPFEATMKQFERDIKIGSTFFLTSPVYSTKIINSLTATGLAKKVKLIANINPSRTVHELEALRKHDERIVSDKLLKEIKKIRNNEEKMLKCLALLMRNIKSSVAGFNIVGTKNQIIKLFKLAGLKSRLKKNVSSISYNPQRLNQVLEARLTLREFEKAYIMRVLKTTSGNRCKAAELLGIHRNTLMRKCDEYNIKL